MAGLIGAAGDITLALQSRIKLPVNPKGSTNELNATPVSKEEADEKERLDDLKAREAANKFEALLIHSMLKNMRKTTMSEGKSNDRAIYDDMLDEKLADTMIEAGGIGIADQIVSQIREQQGKSTTAAETTNDKQRLRELANFVERPDKTGVLTSAENAATDRSGTSTDINHLQLATNLWGKQHTPELSQQQQEFVEPLLPYVRRSAQKLGTSPNAILAVAALETGWGRATIKDEHGNDSHNLFGIKATGSDNRYATTLTTEFVEGNPQKLQARFKTFDSPADAVEGFADFILSNPRYSNALKHAGDPEKFLQELQSAGYATDPRYADKAISIMRQIARNPSPL